MISNSKRCITVELIAAIIATRKHAGTRRWNQGTRHKKETGFAGAARGQEETQGSQARRKDSSTIPVSENPNSKPQAAQ